MHELYFIYQIPFYAQIDQEYKYAYHVSPMPSAHSALYPMVRTMRNDEISPYNSRSPGCLHYLLSPQTRQMYDSVSLPYLMQELVLRSYAFDTRITKTVSNSDQLGNNGTLFAVIHNREN